jgi:hypothetical protein
MKQMYQFGAVFDTSVSLNYTRLNMYGKEPVLLGNYTEIVKNPKLLNELTEFYTFFQKPSSNVEQLIVQLLGIYEELKLRKNFYFYYNSMYWYIDLVEPFFSITYDKIPLPGA